MLQEGELSDDILTKANFGYVFFYVFRINVAFEFRFFREW